jgi:pimeloyl-ACP methyl ester carboxylesterase
MKRIFIFALLMLGAGVIAPPSSVAAYGPPNHDFSAGEPIVSAPGGFSKTDHKPPPTDTFASTSGDFVLINGNANMRPFVTSGAFTVQADGPIFSFYVNTLGDSSAFYSASVGTSSCSSFSQFAGGGSSSTSWQRIDVDFSSYVGQSVCIRYRAYKMVAFQGAATRKIPNWTVTSGTPRMAQRAVIDQTNVALGNFDLGETDCVGEVHPVSVDPAARLFGSSGIISDPFTIPNDATDLRFLFQGQGSAAATISLKFASEGYAIDHLIYNVIVNGNSVLTNCDVTQWQGETAKVWIRGSFGGTLLLGDIGETISRPELPQPVIVLLHGFNSNCGAMTTMEGMLETAYAYSGSELGRVRCFDYTPTEGVRRSAQRLKDYIKGLRADTSLGLSPTDPIHIVAHSFGGLVSRWYLEKLSPQDEGPVASLHMLGTPNDGVWLANVGWALGKVFDDLDGQDLADMRLGSDVINALNGSFSLPGTPQYVGHAGLRGGILGAVFYPNGEENDCIVSQSSVRGPDDVIPGPDYFLLSHFNFVLCSSHTVTNAQEVADNVVSVIDTLEGAGAGAQGSAASSPAPEPDAPAFASIETGVVAPSATNVHQITVPSGLPSASFLVLWNDGSAAPQLGMTLRRPNSTVVSSGNSDVLQSVVVTSNGVADVLMRGFRMSAPAAGTWQVDVTGTSVPSGGQPYMVLMIPESQVQLGMKAANFDLEPNDSQALSAALFDGGTEIAPSAISGEVRKPNGSMVALTFVDDGTGADKQSGDLIYTALLTDTGACGGYTAFASATGTSSEGTVTREALATFSVHVAGDAVMDECDADEDDDALTDEAELATHATDPQNRDTDGDNCNDGAEVQTAPGSQGSGGLRDARYPWDYFNPTEDGFNRSDDISAVVAKYGHDLGVAGDYHVKYDRSMLMPPGYAWVFGPPDGVIRAFDISAAVSSYGHDCQP